VVFGAIECPPFWIEAFHPIRRRLVLIINDGMLTFFLFFRLGDDRSVSVQPAAPPEVEFSGLYTYVVETNTWTKVWDDNSPPGVPIIKSRVGHSMVFHPVSIMFALLTYHMYKQSKRYCPVLVALEGSALWGNTLATALLHDQNWTIPYGLIVQSRA